MAHSGARGITRTYVDYSYDHYTVPSANKYGTFAPFKRWVKSPGKNGLIRRYPTLGKGKLSTQPCRHFAGICWLPASNGRCKRRCKKHTNPKKKTSPLRTGHFKKGKWSSYHHFSGPMLVFRGIIHKINLAEICQHLLPAPLVGYLTKKWC